MFRDGQFRIYVFSHDIFQVFKFHVLYHCRHFTGTCRIIYVKFNTRQTCFCLSQREDGDKLKVVFLDVNTFSYSDELFWFLACYIRLSFSALNKRRPAGADSYGISRAPFK